MSVTQSEKIDQLAAALVKAQQQVKGATKTSVNPYFKSTYADLASVWEACRDALTGNGLAVAQFPGFENGAATLTTVLLHVSGQWIQGTAGAPLKTADAQGVGSALTYLRRYALAAVAGVVQEDDDGEGAVARGKVGRGQKSSGGTKEAPAAPPPDFSKPPAQLAEEADPLAPGEKLMPMGANKGAKLGLLSSKVLVSARDWMAKKSAFPDVVQAIDTILSERGGE